MSDDPWGECIGTARLCDDERMVRTHPDYPQGFLCTGGHHVAFQRYIRCDNPLHDTIVETKWYPARLVSS